MGCQTLIKQRRLLGGDRQKIVIRLSSDMVPQVSDKLKLLLTRKQLDGWQIGKSHDRGNVQERQSDWLSPEC